MDKGVDLWMVAFVESTLPSTPSSTPSSTLLSTLLSTPKTTNRYNPPMELDIFFSISQTEVDGYTPSEREMFRNFFDQVRLADELGFGTAWVAESHLSTETQKLNPGAVIPHFRGEIGLNTDILQLGHKVFGQTRSIHIGSAILNILANGGPIAAAERIATFLSLHGLDESEERVINIGFASGRFPFINIPYGIVPRTPVELAVDGAPRPAPPSVELAAYRLAQEALTNARKHAPGAPVRIEIVWDNGSVALRVADAGPGPARAPVTGYGLVGMRERVRL
ncbi:MAG: LLM class flavin-dependent oxidoreductase, partial [Acidobacteria bacterium]|nr:LLM class flavin-dependent oxidoreductase [Acidobacteriota bacterium]